MVLYVTLKLFLSLICWDSGLSRKEVQYNGRRAVEEVADDDKKNFSLLSFETDAQKEIDQSGSIVLVYVTFA